MKYQELKLEIENDIKLLAKKIEEFCAFYYDFIQNHEQKINLLTPQ